MRLLVKAKKPHDEANCRLSNSCSRELNELLTVSKATVHEMSRSRQRRHGTLNYPFALFAYWLNAIRNPKIHHIEVGCRNAVANAAGRLERAPSFVVRQSGRRGLHFRPAPRPNSQNHCAHTAKH